MERDFIKYILFIIIMGFYQPVFAIGTENISLFQILIKLIFYIGIFIAVIFITLYGTRLIARNYKSYANSKYINVLDTLSISGGMKIIIIKISKKIYIISSTPNNTEVIDIIDEDKFSDKDFNNYLDKYTNKNHNKFNFGIKNIIEKVNFSRDKEDK